MPPPFPASPWQRRARLLEDGLAAVRVAELDAARGLGDARLREMQLREHEHRRRHADEEDQRDHHQAGPADGLDTRRS